MISMPLLPQKNTVEDLYFDDWGTSNKARWRLYSYTGTFRELKSKDIIEPGRAYWLRTKDFTPAMDADNTEIKTPSVAHPFKQALHSGWNCFSNPFYFDISGAHVFLKSGKKPFEIRAYQNQQWTPIRDDSLLIPWSGYLVWNPKSDPSDSLNIFPYEKTPVAKTASNSDMQLDISARYNNTSDGILTARFHGKKSTGLAKSYETPKPTIFNKEFSIGFMSDNGNHRYLTQSKGFIETGKSWRILLEKEKSNGSRIQWAIQGLRHLPEEFQVCLMSETDLHPHIITSGQISTPSHQLQSETFQLMVGTESYLQKQIQRVFNQFAKLHIRQITPNPMRNHMNISFTVPQTNLVETNRIELKLFNLQGKLIKTLINSNYAAGHHQFYWNGQILGKPAASGNYFLQLKTTTAHTSKLLVIIR